MHRASVVALVLSIVVAACAPVAPTSTSPTSSSDIGPASLVPSTREATPSPTASAPAPSASVSAAPDPSAASAALEWTPCRGGSECADVEVPLDYADPSGPTIAIALLRRKATDQARRIGSLLYNPGGPGAPGTDTVSDAHTIVFSPTARARFDIVGFDPRGIGESDGITCLEERPELAGAYPDEPAEIEDWVDYAEAVAGACEANGGELLPHVGTANVARDLDRIREAVGDEQLTYLGHSYGALLGAAYAELFPANARALVLDAPPDPAIDGARLIAGQAQGMERALDRFLASCTSGERSCAFAGSGDPGQAFDEIMAPFEDGDVAGLSGNVAWNGIAIALIVGDWVALEQALDGAAEGTPDLLRGMGSFATDPELLDAYDAVACLDLSVGRTADAYERLARELEPTAPRFGRFLAYSPGWGSIDCASWSVPPQREPRPVSAEGAPPILVIGGTGDPATPHAWAEALAGQLSSGVLLTREGEGHTSYGRNACIAELVDAYLVDLELPEPGTICPP